MKKISLILMALCLLLSVNLSAQKPFAGTVKSETRVEGTDDANITANYPQEELATVMGNMAMVQQEGMIIIQNGDKNQVTLVIDFSTYGMGMYYVTKTINPPKTQEFKYVTDKSDTKTILGYNCYKITSTITDLEEDEETVITYYVSDDFMPNFTHLGQPEMKGFPLMTITEVKNLSSSYTLIEEVKEIKASKKVKETTFMVPTSAKPLSEAPEEIQQMLEGLTAEE